MDYRLLSQGSDAVNPAGRIVGGLVPNCVEEFETFQPLPGISTERTGHSGSGDCYRFDTREIDTDWARVERIATYGCMGEVHQSSASKLICRVNTAMEYWLAWHVSYSKNHVI